MRNLRVIGLDQIEHASVTDVGICRGNNQDNHAALLAVDPAQEAQGHIFLVADGMGAHAVGELASELAAGIIPHTYQKYASEGPVAALRKAFIEANASIHSRGQQNRDFHGMGTTATALLLQQQDAWIGHVGDSRAYRIRNGTVEQLSFDHSLVWEIARRQSVQPETLKGYRSNVIIRSLGPDPLVQVDIEGPHPVRPGDTFLLCSDGLSGQLTDPEIGAVVSVLPPAEACDMLVHLANLRGGPDNVTVTIAHIKGEAGPAEPPPAPPLPRKIDWLHLIPWPPLALVLGVLLAAEAAVLSASENAASKFVFTLAAVVILSGLAGLAVSFFREQNAPHARAPEQRPLHIYRQIPFRIDQTLVDRIARANAALLQIAKAKEWDADWSWHQQHREAGQKLAEQGDWGGAFREYCRALRPFTDVIVKNRLKDDAYPVVWERTA